MDHTVKRLSIFAIVFGLLFLLSVLIMNTGLYHWNAGTSLAHSFLQSVATLIALFAGTAALYRYYSGQRGIEMVLFIGIGFMGTTVIDAYHAIVTAGWFAKAFPNVPHTVAEWSWLSTRMLLSILVVLSLPGLFRKESAPGTGGSAKFAYTIVAVVTVLILVVFMQLPIPYPVYSDAFFDRPLELIPGVLFLIALVGYLIKGDWRTESLGFWMVLFLIVSVCVQFFYIDLSPHSHDSLYLGAHVLKMVSYAMVYIGVTS